MLRQYFNCNEKLEIFLTCFCNILCYVGTATIDQEYYEGKHFFLEFVALLYRKRENIVGISSSLLFEQ